MSFIRLIISQPVTVAVGVILVLLAGLISFQRLPIQLTPSIEDTIISIGTRWEGASPEEVEREIIEPQEKKLQGLTNLRAMTSESQQGQGTIRLEFRVGTAKEDALREVSDKLREVPEYPENADEPVVEASDPENRDYIAWLILETTDPDLEIRTLQDFAEDRVKPVLERIAGMSEVNVIGGRERETQIRFDPGLLARRGITVNDFVGAIQRTNRNASAGELADSKFNVRLRAVSQYDSVEDVLDTVIRQTPGGPTYVRDVAQVVETYKEARTFVRSKGRPVLAINAQKEVGANVLEVMDGLRAAMREMNKPGGLLDTEARRLGLNGTLRFKQVYDQTIYIDDALTLVRNNIFLGGSIAIIVLLLFLRSVRAVGIVALAIPISVVGAVVVMVAVGRSINVISLAGMAFAVGLVVDNAIVVLENIYRHLEMGKKPEQAAYDGAREVWGAILASTLTTIFVFVPILLVKEEAGQLFRDIALAICAAIGLSLLVSISVIPTLAARVLRPMAPDRGRPRRPVGSDAARWRHVLSTPLRVARASESFLRRLPELIGNLVYRICGSVTARLAIVGGLTTASLVGSYFLMPPADYLPTGNRNLVFGVLIPPPGYNLEQQATLAARIEKTIEPFWEAAESQTADNDGATDDGLPEVPTFDWRRQTPGDPVVPPPVENYFLVSFEGIMFHGGVSADPRRAVDMMPLFQQATRPDAVPGVLAFAFQVPLFRLGGSTGSAIKVDFSGDDLAEVTRAASAAYQELIQRYGPQTVQPSPSNFDIYGPEIQVVPRPRRLADAGMTMSDLTLITQAIGDGAIIGEYRLAGATVDLKLISAASVDQKVIGALDQVPVATPAGAVIPIGSLADFRRVTSPPQINHVGRQRSVTLQFTAPRGMPLEQGVNELERIIADLREQGRIAPTVGTDLTGSASKLQSVMRALLGDGTPLGTLGSSLVLALVVVYLLMCVLFQSFVLPLVIMFSVPLATLGGFGALFLVFLWSVTDRYMPIQSMDVLTMLGFVILIGVVVNNAILIVHQSLNFMRGESDVGRGTSGPMEPRRAIAEAVRTRVRPIFMSMLTSVGGMSPLVLMPGSGSEFYRGLGSVVVGGLLVSTVFTIILVPLLLSLVTDLGAWIRAGRAADTDAPSAEAAGATAGTEEEAANHAAIQKQVSSVHD